MVAQGQQTDSVIAAIAEYAVNYDPTSELALDTARLTLMDSIGCAMLAMDYQACTKLLGPDVEGTIVPNGARVIGTRYELDPVKAAFDTGAAIRWLDFNDTWLAAEWGHPSDNFGAILTIADHLSRKSDSDKFTVKDVLKAAIKAYEIQGVLALQNSFNRVGIDHVLLVKVASTAVVTAMLGGDVKQVENAVSNAWLDATLRTYRHAPNTGSRKSWAAGDALGRAVRFGMNAMAGEMGYPSALTAPGWGFQDVWFKGEEITLERELDAYVMENILFKVSFPAEFHAQTAVECAFKLHSEVASRLDDIEEIVITSQESALRIIDKTGPLNNPADRDHCIQYMTAIGLLKGSLTAEDYEDDVASDPRVDALRDKMTMKHDQRFTDEYLDADKRSIANAVQVRFKDGSSTENVTVEYPIGHRRRREDAKPLLAAKFKAAVATQLDDSRVDRLAELFADSAKLESMAVDELMNLLVPAK
ncbi:MAG: bifunctional 2-methylcitrate dehydratase/aconitate hydratase [Chloroflexi bacterium]|nr:bifunctional 2-methylcitrate dehydratase/aconitate hydratase [Chloroflexota bacterium]MBT5627387.1 bifunctional 2-methylcitrate dehydratase/aconitate hydratase [Chloroflexota bacterium]